MNCCNTQSNRTIDPQACVLIENLASHSSFVRTCHLVGGVNTEVIVTKALVTLSESCLIQHATFLNVKRYKVMTGHSL